MKNRKLKNFTRRVTAMLLAALTVLPAGLLSRPAQAAMTTTNIKLVVWDWIDDMQAIGAGADYNPANENRNIAVRDTKYSRIMFYRPLDRIDYYFNASPTGGPAPSYYSSYEEDEIYLDEYSRISDSTHNEWNTDLYMAEVSHGSFFTLGSGERTPYIQYAGQVTRQVYDDSFITQQITIGGHAWRIWAANTDDSWSEYALMQVDNKEDLDVRRTDGFALNAVSHYGADNNTIDSDPWIIQKNSFNILASHLSTHTNHVFWHMDPDLKGEHESLALGSGRKFWSWNIKSGNSDEFNIFLGKEYKIGQLGADFTVQQDQNQSLKGLYYIPEGKTITVSRDGVLSIEGTLLNDGKIVVEDGGLLVVKDGAAILPCTKSKKNCGGITSSGTVIVESNSLLCGGGIDGLKILGGVVVNFGVVAGESMTVSRNYSIDNRDTGWVIAGRSPSSAMRVQLIKNALASREMDFSNPVDYFEEIPKAKGLNSFHSIPVNAVYGNTANVKKYGDKVFGTASDPTMSVYTRAGVSEQYMPLFEDEPVDSVSMTVTDEGLVYTVGKTTYDPIWNKLVSAQIGRGAGNRETIYKDKWIGSSGLESAYVIFSPAHAPLYSLDIYNGGKSNGTNANLFQSDRAQGDLWHVVKRGMADYNGQTLPYYTLESCNAPGKSLDCAGGSQNAMAHIWDSDPNNGNQQWFLVPDGKYLRIVPKAAPTRCLGCAGAGKANGISIVSFTQIDTDDQRWFVSNTFNEAEYDAAVDVGTAVEFVPQNAGGLRLGVNGSAIMTSNDGTYAQRWRLEPAGVDDLDGESKTFYTIVERNTGKALAVSGTEFGSFMGLNAATPGGSELQHWYINDVMGGEYAQIASRANTEYVLTANGNGNAATLRVNTNESSQRWKVNGVKTEAAVLNVRDPLNNQTFTLSPKSAPGMVIGARGNGKNNGANVQLQSPMSTSLAQQWTVKRVGSADLNGSETPYYTIENVNSGKSLDYNGGAANTQTRIWDTNMTNGDQHWFLVTTGDGSYSVIPKAHPEVRLDVAGNSTAAGANVQVSTDNGGDSQKWVLNDVAAEEDLDGKVVTLAPSHAPTMRLDFASYSTANSTKMVIHKSLEHESQRWKLVKRGTTYVNGKRQSYYTIESLYAVGSALDAAGYTNGTQPHIWSKGSSLNNNQLWFVLADGGGTYRIIPRSDTTKCLGCEGGNTDSNTRVVLWDIGENTANQKWKLVETTEPVTLGTFELPSVEAPGFCVDAAATGNGGKVYLYGTHQDDNVRWTFVKMGADARGDYYKVLNKKDGRALDVSGKAANNAEVMLHDYTADAEQLWYLDLAGSDGLGEYYNVVLRDNTKLRLGVKDASYKNSTSMVTTTSTSKNTQFRLLEPVTPTSLGTFEIGSSAAASMRLEPGNSKDNGANVKVWHASAGTAVYNVQKWRIVLRGYALVNGARTPYYSIDNVNSGKVLDLSGKGTSAGVNLANVQQYDYDGYADQHWFIEVMNDGTVKFRNRANEKLYLDAAGMADNSNVLVAIEGNEAYRRWVLYPVAEWKDGGTFYIPGNQLAVEAGLPNTFEKDYNISYVANAQYTITPQHNTGMRIDLPLGIVLPGNIVQLYGSNNTAREKWVIRPVGIDFFDGDGTGHVYYRIAAALSNDFILQSEGVGPVPAGQNFYLAGDDADYSCEWYLEPADGSSGKGYNTDTVYNIIARGTLSTGAVCVEAPDGGGQETKLKTGNLSGNKKYQQWVLDPAS